MFRKSLIWIAQSRAPVVVVSHSTHEMSGDLDAAAALYTAAAGRTTSMPERHYLTMKAARLISRRVL